MPSHLAAPSEIGALSSVPSTLSSSSHCSVKKTGHMHAGKTFCAAKAAAKNGTAGSTLNQYV